MISHSFAKIAASDDGNFILSLREAAAKEGRAGGRCGGWGGEGGEDRKVRRMKEEEEESRSEAEE